MGLAQTLEQAAREVCSEWSKCLGERLPSWRHQFELGTDGEQDPSAPHYCQLTSDGPAGEVIIGICYASTPIRAAADAVVDYWRHYRRHVEFLENEPMNIKRPSLITNLLELRNDRLDRRLKEHPCIAPIAEVLSDQTDREFWASWLETLAGDFDKAFDERMIPGDIVQYVRLMRDAARDAVEVLRTPRPTIRRARPVAKEGR